MKAKQLKEIINRIPDGADVRLGDVCQHDPVEMSLDRHTYEDKINQIMLSVKGTPKHARIYISILVKKTRKK
jgi:hypothetical protein